MFQIRKLYLIRNFGPFINLLFVSRRLVHFKRNIHHESIREPIFSIFESTLPLFFGSNERLVRCYCKETTTYADCWKCSDKNKVKNFFCGQCGAVQKPPENPDLFQLFSIEKNFDVDEVSLAKSFRELQMLLHPDKFSMKDEKEQVIAAEFSSLINKAYSTLKNPWLRAKYLLKTLGVVLDETTSVDDPEFLMKVMEQNEEIADAENLISLEKVAKENGEDIRRIIYEISLHFKQKDIQKLRKNVIELKYYVNIAEKISEKKFEWLQTST